MKETRLMSDKKERNRLLLTERYYGKKALLAEWEQYPDMVAREREYVLDLARRVRGHHNDLTYRGVDELGDFANDAEL